MTADSATQNSGDSPRLAAPSDSRARFWAPNATSACFSAAATMDWRNEGGAAMTSTPTGRCGPWVSSALSPSRTTVRVRSKARSAASKAPRGRARSPIHARPRRVGRGRDPLRSCAFRALRTAPQRFATGSTPVMIPSIRGLSPVPAGGLTPAGRLAPGGGHRRVAHEPGQPQRCIVARRFATPPFPRRSAP
jgi:hypothetical protein